MPEITFKTSSAFADAIIKAIRAAEGEGLIEAAIELEAVLQEVVNQNSTGSR